MPENITLATDGFGHLNLMPVYGKCSDGLHGVFSGPLTEHLHTSQMYFDIVSFWVDIMVSQSLVRQSRVQAIVVEENDTSRSVPGR